VRYCQVHADQDRALPEGHACLAQLHDLLAAPDTAAERKPDLPTLKDRALDLLHTLDLAPLVSGLAGVTLVVRDVCPLLEAPDRLLQARYLLLLGDVELLLTLERQLSRQRVGE
jgi:hypothetical protein